MTSGRISGRLLFSFPAAGIILFFYLCFSDPLAAQEDPLEQCRIAFAADPEAWESARCFVYQATTPVLIEEAQQELLKRQLLRPDSGPLALALGYIEEDRFKLSRDPVVFDGALAHFRQAVKNFAEAADSLGGIRALHSQWRLYRTAGRLQEAEVPVRLGLELAKGSSDPRVRLEAAMLAAGHADATGVGLGRCLDRLTDAYAGFPEPDLERPDPDQLRMHRRALKTLVTLSNRLRRLEEVLETSRLLAQVSKASGARAAELRAKYDIARAYVSFFERGEETRQEALAGFRDLLEEAGDWTLDAIAFSHLELGQLVGGPEGREHLEECLRISRQLAGTNEAPCLFALAEWELERDPAAATRALREGLRAMRDNLEPYLLLRVWPAYLRTVWATKSNEQALDISFEVLDAIEEQWALQQKDTVGGEYASVAFLEHWSEAYYWLAGKLLTVRQEADDAEMLELAFEVSERMRGRVLLDALKLSAIAPEAPLDESALAEAREANFALVGRLKESLWQMTEPASSEETPNKAPEHLAYKRLYHPEIVGLEEVQALLAEDQALLSFQLIAVPDIYGRFTGGSWVMVVRRDEVKAIRLPSARDVRNQLRFFRSGVASGDATPGRAEWLHDQLLGEALKSLPASVEHLILIPDGELYGLAFSALKSAEEPRPLGARFRLSVVPSATLWSRWSRGSGGDAGGSLPATVLAFADPRQDQAPEVLASLAKQPVALPRARQEGRRLTRLFGGSSRLATGKDATEGLLRSIDLAPYGLLHFATHTVVDHENPYRSAVILAAGTGGDDGLVRPAEIAELELEGRLVVLSACDTAAGEILRGEGVMGLARAFFVAGAKTVVGTLWPVEDGDAERFFVGFYDRLHGGASVSEAVRGTQEELWRAGAPAQAWAGIVVLGDGDLALPPGEPSSRARGWWVLGLVLIGLALIGLVLFGLLRRRGSPSHL